MPVKIKHKHDGEIKTVAYVDWISNYHQDVWEVLGRWDIVKIYNIQSNPRVYQSTVDKQDFFDAIKHPENKNALDYDDVPDIIERDKESVFNRPVNAALGKAQMDVKIWLEGKNQSDLRKDFPIKNPKTAHITDHTKNNQPGTWVKRIFNKIVDSTVLLVITILGTLIGTLLVLMVVSYYHHKGFSL